MLVQKPLDLLSGRGGLPFSPREDLLVSFKHTGALLLPSPQPLYIDLVQL